MTRRNVTPLLALCLCLTPGAFAKGVTVSQNDYESLVRECRGFLAQREITEAEAKRLAARLRAVGFVATGKTVLPVNTKGDADALAAVTGTTPDKKLLARFASLDEQLRRSETLAPKGDPKVVAQSVLSASEFTASRPEPAKGDGWDLSFLPNWAKPIGNFFKPALKWLGDGLRTLGKWFVKGIENVFRAIGKFFRWLFNKFPQNKFNWNPKNPFASVGNGVLLALYFIATVAATVGVYFLSRYLFDLYEAKAGRGRRAGMLGGDLDLSKEGITDPLTTAKQRASEGDYRSAIRLLYIASLWKLGESGVLTLEKNCTNWEYQRALRQKTSTVADDFLPATRLFDRVWYGRQAGTQAEFETVSAIHDRLPDSPPADGQPSGDQAKP